MIQLKVIIEQEHNLWVIRSAKCGSYIKSFQTKEKALKKALHDYSEIILREKGSDFVFIGGNYDNTENK